MIKRPFLNQTVNRQISCKVIRPIYETLSLQQSNAIKLAVPSPRNQLNQIIQSYYTEIWNEGNLDYLEEIFHPDVIITDQIWQEDGFEGLKRVRKVFAEFLQAYPNQTYKIDNVILDDISSKAVVEWTSTCHNLGTYLGRPPTGKHSEVKGVDVFQFTPEFKISQVRIYRQALAEERAAYYEWDSY
eukprot:TRINITY_DN532_c0_g1_i1.p2 TRINITY_DN532_c0_g1~~TRINITY_DN532_c0_g1_i1.p2  ORF type:complete len:210 (+),score=8.21 TRINITY_DN532_c0_g1_i1:74-631(+)